MEMINQSADALQILASKVFSIIPKWRAEISEALKCQFPYRLVDPHFSALGHKMLITGSQQMNFTEFWAKCVSIFGTQYKGSQVAKVPTNAVVNTSSNGEYKTTSQLKRAKKKNNVKKKQPPLYTSRK